LLYVPGSDLHKIEKAAALGADCVCLDLEDSVAENMKSAARGVITGALGSVDFGRSERMVRVNSFASGRALDDAAAVLSAHPQAILLPKVDDAAQISAIDNLLRSREEAHGWPVDEIALLVIVESARGMLNLDSICAQVDTCPRFQGIVFGAEDFSADMGITRTQEAAELLFARSRLVMYCAAFGLQAIDMVTVNFKDAELLDREAIQGMQMGFTGKQVIHPAQVEPVKRIFTPSSAEVEKALLILRKAKEFASEGKGAFALDGQMVDRPVIKRAELILARAGIMLE
jgi:citrate lyase subunit beta-like protein